MKNKKTINRRSFLKSLGVFLIGFITLPFSKEASNVSANEIKPKEAKFYTTGNDLAG